MRFDSATLLLATGYVALIGAVFFALLYRGLVTAIDGLRTWAAGNLLIGFGLLLLPLSADAQYPGERLWLALLLLLFGFVAWRGAIRRFLQQPPIWWRASLVALLALGAIAIGVGLDSLLTPATAYMLALWWVWGGAVADLRQRAGRLAARADSQRATPAAQLLAGLFMAMIVALGAQWATALFEASGWIDQGASATISTLALAALLATGVMLALGFLLLAAERLRDELEDAQSVDSLTQLSNRRAFWRAAEDELARLRREDKNAVLLMMDLDRFKVINETFGHLAGDQVLADFAAHLRASAGARDLLGRYGGDEFCMLLPDCEVAAAHALANRIRTEVLERQVPGLERRLQYSVSIGVAAVDPVQFTLESMVAAADAALGHAKQSRNAVVVAVPGVTHGVPLQQELPLAARGPYGDDPSDLDSEVAMNSHPLLAGDSLPPPASTLPPQASTPSDLQAGEAAPPDAAAPPQSPAADAVAAAADGTPPAGRDAGGPPDEAGTTPAMRPA